MYYSLLFSGFIGISDNLSGQKHSIGAAVSTTRTALSKIVGTICENLLQLVQEIFVKVLLTATC